MFYLCSKRITDTPSCIVNLGAQLSRLSSSPHLSDIFVERISAIGRDSRSFKTQMGQFRTLMGEFAALKRSLANVQGKYPNLNAEMNKTKNHVSYLENHLTNNSAESERLLSDLKTKAESTRKEIDENEAEQERLKGEIKAKGKEALIPGANNLRIVLFLESNVEHFFETAGCKRPKQQIAECNFALKRARWELVYLLDELLKPLAPNSIFTLIGKMAEIDLEAAYACAKAVPEELYRSWSLSEVSERVAATDPQRGLEIISEITEPNAKLLAYSKLITKILSVPADKLDKENARRIAEQIQDENVRQWALGKIADK